MESISQSDKASEPPSYRWATILGTIIALLTLTFPLAIIAVYSPQNSVDSLPPAYSLAKPNH